MSESLRVLVVEDNPADVDLIREALPDRGGVAFQVEAVSRVAEAVVRLAAGGIDLVLIDLGLPDSQGLETFHKLQKASPSTPAIVLTGNDDQEAAIAAVRDGAQDYLVKGQVDAERLVRSARYAVERKRAAWALRQSEERYRSLFDNMLNGFAYCRMVYEGEEPRDFIYLAVNDAFEKLTGLKDVVGKKVSEVIPGIRESDARLLECYGRVARTGVAEMFEIYVDALKMWFSISVYSPVQDHFLAVFDVITERKRAEARVRHLNDVLRAVQNVNELIVRERNPDRILAEACQILAQTRGYRLVWIGGVSPDSKRVVPLARAGVGADYLDTVSITWDDSDTGRGPIGTALRTRKGYVCQDIEGDPLLAPWREAARARGFASLAAVPMVNATRLFGAISVYADRPGAFDAEEVRLLGELADDLAFALQSIEGERARWRDQAALRASEERLRDIIGASEEFIWETNAEGRFTYVSERSAAIVGYGPEELVGRLQFEFVENAGKHEALWRESARTKATVREVVVRQLTKSGRPVCLSITAVPIIGPAGEFAGFRGAALDITDRLRLQEENDRIEVQLRQAQKLESIGTLAGGVAHEINNPIMGIMNYAQLILDQLGPDSPVAEYATEIGRESERVAAIVKNLLSFARQDKEAGRKAARLGDIVEGTLSLIKTVMRHDQIVLTVDVPSDLPEVQCRSQQIRQVIMNLLTNARDALNERYPGHDPNKAIIISAREVSLVCGRPARAVRLTVEDHGPGIPDDLRKRIFDPFFTTKPHDKGTGLGLSISHGIVKDHGGELSVESAPGQWTRFHIDLPVGDV